MNPLNAAVPSASDRSVGSLIAVSVGNTRSRIGLFRGAELIESGVHGSKDAEAIAQVAAAMAERSDGEENPAVVMSSVHRSSADAIERAVAAQGLVVHRFGRDMAIPIVHSLDDSGAKTVGQDRLLCAIGAYSIVRQACVVVDLGTALTVDFVDGEGVFHGGAIAPGVAMMLRALHQQTDALPEIEFKMPEAGVHFGKNTADAMRLGAVSMVCGSVRWLAERYAEYYEAYPRVIGTGGDMGVLESDGLVETFLPDLQLVGIRRACELLLASDEEDAAS